MNDYYELRKFDRVILIMDFKSGDNIIPSGTIGTYRATINDSSIVQITDVQIVSLPDTLLQKAEQADLDKVENPENLVPRMYHIGNAWAVQTGYDGNNPIYIGGKIVGIRLAANEAFDKIKIKLQSGIEKEYEKRFLENHGSYLPDGIPEYVPGLVPDKQQEEKENE